MTASSFDYDAEAIRAAIDALGRTDWTAGAPLPGHVPETGVGEAAALEQLAPLVLGQAARLDAPHSLAHMDPPTPWVSWALTLWNARLNQNLLHPDTGPFAREAEARVMAWLAPFFGMRGGHMTPGSTVANLTAVWAAREIAGARRVVASAAAHLSLRKSAHLLGLPFATVPTDARGRLDAAHLGELDDACLVLTAGTTQLGAIDPLALAGRAAWTHVDGAWAGPLRLTDAYAGRLAGLEAADSVSVSAHKLLFQPKESALVLFRDADRAHSALSFGAGYLTVPNVGLLGSHGATAIPLLGTLLAWGRRGMAEHIEACMAMAEQLEAALRQDARFELRAPAETGVVVFRPTSGRLDALRAQLAPGTVSTTVLDHETWLRCVAANPRADVERVIDAILAAG